VLADDPGGGPAADRRLRLLHEVMNELRRMPRAAEAYVAYVELLRSVRERLHPIGVADHRLIETPGGRRFRVNVGERLGSDFYYGFDADRTDAEVVTALVDRGDVVVDVGANFGYYTVLTAEAAGATGVVHAFEPDPDAFKLLTDNVALNGLDNVRLYDLCLGAEDAEVDFYLMEESAFSGLAPTGRARPRGTMRAAMRRLDSVLEEHGRPTATLMKIDVEGHEYGVLAGARETLHRSRDAIVVMLEVSAKNLTLERRARLDGELRALAADSFRGWVARLDDGSRYHLHEVAEAASLSSGNVFLARAGSSAESRLREAVRRLNARAGGDEQGSLLSRAGHRDSETAARLAEQLEIVRDRDARIAALLAELHAARTQLDAARTDLDSARTDLDDARRALRALEQRVETRIGAGLRRFSRPFLS
jgi:FkbM family methyltransferase